ncbi:MAG: GPO family capsid scaffolding protein [Rhodocyclaceae bacterium]|nr:GPO family capsid scaffolding protein [Rhodocyclaceae bacterium]
MATKSKFFRIATEGDTTDGRVIERSWLEQMAETYNAAKYGARVCLEHIRGILPDGPFKAYGDVTAVKTEEVVIDGQKKLALMAQIDPTPDLVAMTKARQKIYTSIEVDPNFAKSGKAYLVGLAVTDSPASLGTEMLAFAAKATINPLAERKQSPDNVFTAAQEVALEFEAVADAPVDKGSKDGETLFTRVKELLTGKSKDDASRFADVGQAVETLAESQKGVLEKFTALAADLKAATDKVAALETAAGADRQAFAALKAKLDAEPGNPSRPEAAGGNGTITTDC